VFVGFRDRRFFSGAATDDVRGRLLSELKTAMKNKDSFTSTTLRSVLSEVYAADKISPPKITSSAITTIIRKSNTRRVEAAAQFTNASRLDLAEKERREADILSAFLPPLLTDSEIERILRDVVAKHKTDDNSKRVLGKVFKDFYAEVDRSAVDKGLVKRKAETLLSDAK